MTVTPALLRRFERAYADWRTDIQSFCRARRIAHHEADCHQDFDDIMMDLLRSGDFAR